MIIPLTHERATVRRMPWVTVTIIALCVVVALLTTGSRHSRETEALRREALEYVELHPYLEVDSRLVPPQVLEAAIPSRLRQPPPGADLETEQTELDRRTDRYLASLEREPLWRWGLVPADVDVPDLVTHLFLHGGFLHLLFNMIFLYLTAPFVEDAWGPGLFAGVYLGIGVLAGGLYALQYPDLDVPLVGASGAVAGIMGAFLLVHGRARIRFLVFLGVMIGTFSAPAWVILPLWFLGELFAALRADALAPGMGGGGVAYWAHVWGFAAGIGAAVAIRRSGREELPEDPHEPLASRRSPVSAAVRQARKEIERGIYPRAWTILEEELEKRPDDPEAVRTLWELAVFRNRVSEAAPALRGLVRREIRQGRLDEALFDLESLVAEGAHGPETAALELRLAERLARSPDRRAIAIELLERAAETDLGQQAPGVLARSTRLAARLDPDLARSFLPAAVRHPELDAATRRALLELVQNG